MLDNLTISGIIIAVLLSATVLRFIYSDGRRAKRTPDGAHPVIQGNAMKTMTGSRLDLVDGAADETKPVEPWNGLHLGAWLLRSTTASVPHRVRSTRMSPGIIRSLAQLRKFTGWCDPDPFASHRRAMHRAGFTFVSSAPNARTKPKPYEGGGRERLHAEGWEPMTLNLTDQVAAAVRRVAERERFTLGEAVVMLATRQNELLPLTPRGKPPALPGDSPRFDLYDGRRESPISAKRRRRTMKEYQSLIHTKWDCKYHVIFIPKAQEEADLRGAAPPPGTDLPRVGGPQGLEGG